MAEAILRHESGGRVRVESAGTAPQPDIHPMAKAAVARLLNLDMAGQYPKKLDRFLNDRFDEVITVCDRAAETCPIFPGHPAQTHWSLVDPAAATGTDEEKQRAFDATATDLLSRIRSWLDLKAES
jgi:protein-tyrosine-phosphatase